MKNLSQLQLMVEVKCTLDRAVWRAVYDCKENNTSLTRLEVKVACLTKHAFTLFIDRKEKTNDNG